MDYNIKVGEQYIWTKIREELEIVSSDDLNSLLNRLNKLKDEIKDTNNTTVKPKTDSSEIDKANIKLDNLRKKCSKWN